MKSILPILFFLPLMMFSQQRKIDSLRNLINTEKSDTLQAIHLYQICFSYANKGQYDSAFYFGNRCLQLSTQLKYDNGIANAYNSLGIVYDEEGNYATALENYLKALKIFEATGNKKGIANAYNNIGIVYDDNENPNLALENYHNALQIFEELHNDRGMANGYSNIGIIYKNQNKVAEALDNFTKALKIRKQIGDNPGIASSYNNIGSAYSYMAHHEEKKDSIDKYLNAALENFSRAMAIYQQINNRRGLAAANINCADIYITLRQFEKSIDFSNKALSLGKESGSKSDIKEAYHALASAYYQLNDFKKAYDFNLLWEEMKDSISGQGISSRLDSLQQNYEKEKEKQIQDLIAAKKESEHQAELKQRSIIIYSILSGLVLVILFSIFLFNRFRIIRNQKEIIEKQKLVVEEHQKEIVDSIHYAKRIQQSMMPTEKYIDKILRQRKG